VSIRRNLTKASILKECDDSLRRLQTEVIDLYQCHWPDPATPMEETMEALEILREQGKIRWYGVSNFDADLLNEAVNVGEPVSLQPKYSLLSREIEQDVLPWAREHGVKTVTYGALCRGLLTGKMTEHQTFEGDDLRKADPKFQSKRFGEYLHAVEAFEELAHDRFDTDVLTFSVRWLLDHGSDIALWGARRPEQIEAVDRLWGWQFDPATHVSVDQILERHVNHPVGPEFMAPPEKP